MRKALLNIVVVALVAKGLTSCKEAEPAQLIKFQNLEFGPVAGNEAHVRGEAVLYNPNTFGVRIKEIQLKIDIENTEVATLREVKAVKAGGKKQFVVPFQGQLALADIQKIVEKDGLAYLLGKKVSLRFRGQIKTSLSGWGTTIPVDVKEDVSLGRLLSK